VKSTLSPAGASVRPRLQVTRRLLDALEKSGVRFCHWKSNDRLEEGLCGDTDLDLLVDRQDQALALQALVESGFKRCRAASYLTMTGKEGWFGLDCATGRLAYVDLHYALVTGAKQVKSYELPWSRAVLDSRVWDEEGQVPVCHPAVELVLLIVRAAIRLRPLAIAWSLLGRRPFRGNWSEQRRFLLARRAGYRRPPELEGMLPPDVLAAVEALVHSDPGTRELLRLRRRLRPWIRDAESLAPGPRVFEEWRRWLWAGSGAVMRRLRPDVVSIPRKQVASGGLYVVLLGADGSGKSTLARGLLRELAGKLDTERVYLGAGDGKSSLLRRPLIWARDALVRAGLLRHERRAQEGSPARPARARAGASPRRRLPVRLARAVWALVLAREKGAKLRRSWRKRHAGAIVIADRYPQVQLPGFNDGPLLHAWRRSGSGLRRWLGELEGRCYERAARQSPDLVIRLAIDVETAVARDPNLDPEFSRRRIEAVRSFRFPPATRVVELGAREPAEVVRRRALEAIWSSI